MSPTAIAMVVVAGLALGLALLVGGRLSRALRLARQRNRRLRRELEERTEEARRSSLELREVRRRLQDESMTDPVTGVANRTYLDEHFRREWKRAARAGRPLAVLMVEVDRIGDINDAYGRRVGDDCLRAVAGSLERVTKRAEDFVARYEKVRFAVVAPSADTEGVTRIAERIHGRVAALDFLHDGHFVPVTVSVGAAATVPSGGGAENLLAAASAALDRAKTEGRDRTVVVDAASTE